MVEKKNKFYPHDHPEILKRLRTIKEVGAKKAFFLSLLYLAAVFTNGFLLLLIINIFHPLNAASVSSVILAGSIFLVVTMADFTLLFYNKITPAILTLTVIFAWFLLPYQLISGKNIIDKNKTPLLIKKGIFYRLSDAY